MTALPRSSSSRSRHHPPLSRSWLVWGVAATFYFNGFYQRVAPAVMTDRLMADFAIGAATLGHLSAFYFYSYVAMQIPTGFLADLWGPRRLIASGALIAALGTLVFALAPGVGLAATGRLLIGASVAVAWVALIKLASQWFPSRFFATVTGMALFCGIAGAVSAGVPLRFLIDGFGWRPVMLGLALITFVQAAVVWLVVRDDPGQAGYRGYIAAGASPGAFRWRSVGTALATVFRYRNTWLLTLAPGALVGSATAFCGLWGLPFLTTHYRLAPTEAAVITSVCLIAWGRRQPHPRRPIRPDRPAEAALRGIGGDRCRRLGGDRLDSGFADLAADARRLHRRLRRRRHHHRLRPHQGIRAGVTRGIPSPASATWG